MECSWTPWTNNAVSSEMPRMVENISHVIEYCLAILQTTNDAHIDVYWTWWAVLSSEANQFSVSCITLCFVCTWTVVNKLWPSCILQFYKICINVFTRPSVLKHILYWYFDEDWSVKTKHIISAYYHNKQNNLNQFLLVSIRLQHSALEYCIVWTSVGKNAHL